MSKLRKALTEYLLLRRAMGFKLYRPGKALLNFVKFAERSRVQVITITLALRWAKLPNNAQPDTWALRLGLVRGFANYCHAIEPRTEVPPTGLLPFRCLRKTPYIYSQAEIRKMLDATKKLFSKGAFHMRPHTYKTFFGLLATTGMRISEARLLDDSDVDLQTAVLIIRATKFGKARLIPLHSSTCAALHRYRILRNRHFPQRGTTSFFANIEGTYLSESAIRSAFRQILRLSAIQAPPSQRHPRIHDLRHTFAVQSLRRWYRSNRNVQVWLPRLSTYLGHVHVHDTYWYFTAVPDLLRAAAQRLEHIERRFPHAANS
jgi:integrase/recombinase XerD